METDATGALHPAGASGRIPGNKGIWAGISCELFEFAVMFLIYFVARSHYPQAFRAGAERLSLAAGTAITLLMVSSSFCIACSVNAIKAGRRRASFGWLAGALAVAVGYPLVKWQEVHWNLAHGIDGAAGIFFTVYYYLTLNHLVHSCWGILGMLWVLSRHASGAYSAQQHDGLEALGAYWHATDIIWLAIFPLCYVLA